MPLPRHCFWMFDLKPFRINHFYLLRSQYFGPISFKFRINVGNQSDTITCKLSHLRTLFIIVLSSDWTWRRFHTNDSAHINGNKIDERALISFAAAQIKHIFEMMLITSKEIDISILNMILTLHAKTCYKSFSEWWCGW